MVHPSDSPQTSTKERLRIKGFRAEERPYHPHVSLARGIQSPFASEPIEPLEWPVNDFCLVRSEFRPTRYTVLRTWPLP